MKTNESMPASTSIFIRMRGYKKMDPGFNIANGYFNNCMNS
jgi:hypothetical protein